MNDNDLQGFASFIDSLYHRPTDDSRDEVSNPTCKWCDEELTDEQVERGNKLYAVDSVPKNTTEKILMSQSYDWC